MEEMAFGQNDEGAGTPGWGNEPHLLAPYIFIYFYTYPLKCFLFHWSFNLLIQSIFMMER